MKMPFQLIKRIPKTLKYIVFLFHNSVFLFFTWNKVRLFLLFLFTLLHEYSPGTAKNRRPPDPDSGANPADTIKGMTEADITDVAGLSAARICAILEKQAEQTSGRML
jgi:hypothetical protein